MGRRRGKRNSKHKRSADPTGAVPPLRPDGTRDWTKLEARTKREMDRNVGRIDAGETFRSGKHAGPEAAPSKNRGGKYS
jgi:hypothetical protein